MEPARPSLQLDPTDERSTISAATVLRESDQTARWAEAWSEYFRRNIRFSTQPLEQPKNVQHLWSVLEAMDGEHTLMFASDYPHWDYDDANALRVPAKWRERIMGLNALEVYKRIPRPVAVAAE